MTDIKRFFVKSAIALSLFALYGCDNAPDNDSYDAAKAQQEEDDFVNTTAKNQTIENINKDCQELVPYLSKMREQDPSVMEIYYGINEKDGKTKELHIVRADRDILNVSSATCDSEGVVSVREISHSSSTYVHNNVIRNSSSISGNDVNSEPVHNSNNVTQAHSSPSFTDHVFPLVGGVAAGYMLSQYINAGRGNGINYLASNYQNTSYQNLDDQERRKRRGVITSSYINTVSNNNKVSLRKGIKTGEVKMPSTSRTYQSKSLTTRSSGFFKSSGGARSGGYSKGG